MSRDKKELPTVAIYTDMDTVFDTVYALLAKTHDDDEYLERLLKQGFYAREIDEFEGYTYEEFKKLYKTRDSSILPYLVPNSILERLTEFTAKTYFNLLNSPFHAKPKVIFNTYPYVLSDKATATVVEGLRVATRSMSDIEVIHVDPLEITPKYIEEQSIGIVLARDGLEWLENQCALDNFEGVKITDVELVVPLLFPGRSTKEDITLEQFSFDMRNLGLGLIQISFLDAYEFCLLPPV